MLLFWVLNKVLLNVLRLFWFFNHQSKRVFSVMKKYSYLFLLNQIFITWFQCIFLSFKLLVLRNYSWNSLMVKYTLWKFSTGRVKWICFVSIKEDRKLFIYFSFWTVAIANLFCLDCAFEQIILKILIVNYISVHSCI